MVQQGAEVASGPMPEPRKIQADLNPPPADSPFRDYLVFFLKLPIPLVIFVVLVALIVARVIVGGFTMLDLWLIIGLVAAYPVLEWFIHRVILHSRPHEIAGRTVEFPPARNHRAHHESPEDLTKTLPDTTRNLLIIMLGTAIPTFVILRDVGYGLTVMCFVVAALLAYEWSHYLMHTTYRGPVLRKVRKAHLLHHYHNERYWQGIVTRIGDFIMRTNPSPEDVPRLPTAPPPPQVAIG